MTWKVLEWTKKRSKLLRECAIRLYDSNLKPVGTQNRNGKRISYFLNSSGRCSRSHCMHLAHQKVKNCALVVCSISLSLVHNRVNGQLLSFEVVKEIVASKMINQTKKYVVLESAHRSPKVPNCASVVLFFNLAIFEGTIDLITHQVVAQWSRYV